MKRFLAVSMTALVLGVGGLALAEDMGASNAAMAPAANSTPAAKMMMKKKMKKTKKMKAMKTPMSTDKGMMASTPMAQ
jgi:hypothetical protein